ncbi:cupin domain-containing protein [Rhodoferax sp. AJA081-3]|uniref:cupin domain-containing protein n=1 Tax=Rhodoferax sp. AJA081-3 TaxID=2752316 RepID=UPI001ADEF05B|nr:cupin domain-containing protein [Rhodoferax sp. AJA081-3]QTN29569.1 cupin domain-containing protein [Rhodoferax sp. AJA081-3]
MNIDTPLQLLGGLAPKTFMQRHWQKKPLVIRQAIPGFVPPLDRSDLLDLAAQEEVQSRLVVQASEGGKQPWRFKHGPFGRKALPPFKQTGWTLLVQGVDLLDERVHALMNQFRFVPDARLDDVMVSYATDGGGVGPHFDSYDVFLLQAHGQRRWRIGKQKDLSLQPGMPLKILAHFEPEMEFVLNPGDMLYLPPRYAHDGIAEGECMTYSIGFRAPSRSELAGELLQRLAEDAGDAVGEGLYADPKQAAVAQAGQIPDTLVAFARKALEDALRDPLALQRILGEYLTEPKGHVLFDAEATGEADAGLVLDRRTRMAYDAKHVFINGESFLASGRDAQLMRLLADERVLGATSVKRLSAPARELVQDWLEAGWIHGDN